MILVEEKMKEKAAENFDGSNVICAYIRNVSLEL